MAEEALNLALVCDASHVVQAAEELHRRLRPGQWSVLTKLAAEIVALQERAASGSAALVVVASPEQVARVVRELG